MRTAVTVLVLAAAGFVLTADDVVEEATPPETEEAAPPADAEEAPPADAEAPEVPEACEALEDEKAKAKCIADAAAPEVEEEAPKKAGKGRSSSGNMDMEGGDDE
jgi:hypothetical protein